MKPVIKDEFTDLKISRQRKKQLRYKKAGLCQICGQPNYLGGARCEKHRKIQLAKSGDKPWKKGGPGRPPLEYRVLGQIPQ